ncbi:MAG TPA: hypothetical protein VM689_12380 [Aliidongia sp.]|nr:hypothetical protein [Aliidongia sp.]
MPFTKPLNVRGWIAIAIALITILSASRIWLIPTHFSSDPNEGWNAFQASRAFGTGPLYSGPQALIGNNYPPLSFYLVGWAGRLLGDPIVAGRIIALLAVLAVAGCIFVAVRRFSVAGSCAPTIGALLFLAFNVTLFRSYLCMNDPQWLAHALMMAGIALLIPNRPYAPPITGNLVVAALLVVAGGIVKHNLVAFPLAATLWLALHHRRSLALWIGTAVTALLLSAALCYRAYGIDFFADLVFVDRHYSWLRMILRSTPVVLATLPLLIVSAGLVRDRKSDSRLDLLLIAIAISVPLGILQRSGQGVDRNAHFEALIALCTAAAVALPRRRAAFDKPVFAQPLPWLILPLLVILPTSLDAEVIEIAGSASAEASWKRLEDRIAATPGKVACETPALCYWAGKSFEIDFFLYGQRVALRHDAGALQRAIDEHRFAAIEMDSAANVPPGGGEVVNPILPIIGRYYGTVFVNDDGRRLLGPVQ